MADDSDETTVALPPHPGQRGRILIEADYEAVTRENLMDVLDRALAAHHVNRSRELWLWEYYKGRQPILGRRKDVRPDICNRIVENHAQEIVAFKVGYQLAEPLQYTLRNHDGTVGPEGGEGETEGGYGTHLADLNELNMLVEARDKASLDRDLFEHMCVTGVGYRLVEVARDPSDGVPFDIHVLDPWDTFVVHSSAYHHDPIMAVWEGRAQDDSKRRVLNVYTPSRFYRVVDHEVVEDRPHTYGAIPIVEYRLNSTRMGVFEPVLGLLDAINAIESNRMDGIEQTVQSLMKFVNCDIDEDTFTAMLQLGAVKVASPEGKSADVDFIVNDLDQSQTQVTKDDLYQAVVNICGMPNRSNGTSTSDTGAAVLLRDGWTLAESHAKSYELQFKRAERRFLGVLLAICEQSGQTSVDLRPMDVELTFNRRNYENVATKAQVLTGMLACDSIHPELAFKACGLFTDPEAAYLQSRRWADRKAEEDVPGAPGAPADAADAANGAGAREGGVLLPSAPPSQAATPELEPVARN